MQRLLVILVAVALCSCAIDKEKAPHSVRLRFVPVDANAECGGGANFTRLCPAPDRSGAVFAMVHAGLRDEFPVQDQEGHVLFRVAVPDATDERFVLEIQTDGGSQTINLMRDKPVTVEVAGGSFEFYYPTSHVSSADRTTTHKALLIVTRLP